MSPTVTLVPNPESLRNLQTRPWAPSFAPHRRALWPQRRRWETPRSNESSEETPRIARYRLFPFNAHVEGFKIFALYYTFEHVKFQCTFPSKASAVNAERSL